MRRSDRRVLSHIESALQHRLLLARVPHRPLVNKIVRANLASQVLAGNIVVLSHAYRGKSLTRHAIKNAKGKV